MIIIRPFKDPYQPTRTTIGMSQVFLNTAHMVRLFEMIAILVQLL